MKPKYYVIIIYYFEILYSQILYIIKINLFCQNTRKIFWFLTCIRTSKLRFWDCKLASKPITRYTKITNFVEFKLKSFVGLGRFVLFLSQRTHFLRDSYYSLFELFNSIRLAFDSNGNLLKHVIQYIFYLSSKNISLN